MARKHRFRFGLLDVFPGGLHSQQGRRWLFANSFATVAWIGALGSDLFGVECSGCCAA